MKRLLAAVALAVLSLNLAWATEEAPSAAPVPRGTAAILETTPDAGTGVPGDLVVATTSPQDLERRKRTPRQETQDPPACGDHPCLLACIDEPGPPPFVCIPDGEDCTFVRQGYNSCTLTGGGTLNCGTHKVWKTTCNCRCPYSNLDCGSDTEVTVSCAGSP